MKLIIDRRLGLITTQIAMLEYQLKTNAFTDLEREQMHSDIDLCYQMALDLIQQVIQQRNEIKTGDTPKLYHADTLLADVWHN